MDAGVGERTNVPALEIQKGNRLLHGPKVRARNRLSLPAALKAEKILSYPVYAEDMGVSM